MYDRSGEIYSECVFIHPKLYIGYYSLPNCKIGNCFSIKVILFILMFSTFCVSRNIFPHEAILEVKRIMNFHHFIFVVVKLEKKIQPMNQTDN